ncbi:MAG: hypothetical protein LBP22_03555 [Deltaproteobacteria bacterium]|nr:hypothetical protein [Deltaproteobacteria bacterium]
MLFPHADAEKAAFTAIKECILEGRQDCDKSDVEWAANRQKSIASLRTNTL